MGLSAWLRHGCIIRLRARATPMARTQRTSPQEKQDDPAKAGCHNYGNGKTTRPRCSDPRRAATGGNSGESQHSRIYHLQNWRTPCAHRWRVQFNGIGPFSVRHRCLLLRLSNIRRGRRKELLLQMEKRGPDFAGNPICGRSFGGLSHLYFFPRADYYLSVF